MFRPAHIYFALTLCAALPACAPAGPDEPGWIPRTETAAAIRDYHRALAALARTRPHDACRLGRFGIAQLILAAQDTPPGHQAQLFANFGIACDDPRRNPDCAARLFQALGAAFDTCATVDPEAARWGHRFLRWQGLLKDEWDREHFQEAVDLLQSPLARLTRLALLGAFLHSLPLLADRSPAERTWQFVRWLGFPCPAWASSFSPAGPEDNPDTWPAYCLPTCPEASIAEPLADFTLRARRLAAACSPESVGLTRPGDLQFYTLDNHLVFRSASFWRRLLADTLEDPHPYAVRIWPRLAPALQTWRHLELELYPARGMGGQEPEVPTYSRAAVEPVAWPVVHLDPFGQAILERPSTFLPAFGEVRPGARETLDAGGSFPAAADRVAALSGDFTVALSGRASSDQVTLLAARLRAAGHPHLRLLFRNASQVLRACTVDLAGPPPAEHDLRLTFGPDELSLASGAGPLAGAPWKAAGPYDFSGLRQKLENLRHKTPRAAVMHLQLKSGIALTTVAKLLGYVMRNASGRTLFGTVRLTVEAER